MTTITIDIPDDKISEVLVYLKSAGVEVRETELTNFDNLTKKDYQKHFSEQGKINRRRNIKFMDTTEYLLSSPANAKRLSESIEDYKQGLGK